MEKRKLSIELVPKSAWFRNLRSMLSKKEWDFLRKETYKRVGYKCEICGGVGPKWPVECHEKWEYDDENHIAKLVGLYGICPSCHEVKHIGLAQIKGRLEQASKHMAKVNEISRLEAESMIVKAFDIWKSRSEHNWDVDIEWVKKQTES